MSIYGKVSLENKRTVVSCYCDYRHLRSTAFRRRRRHSVRSGVPPSHRVSFYRHIRRHGKRTWNGAYDWTSPPVGVLTVRNNETNIINIHHTFLWCSVLLHDIKCIWLLS